MPKTNWSNFEEPKSYDDADDRRIRLVGEIEEIDHQLGNPLKKKDFGTLREFYAWRQSTKWARTMRLQELRLVKAWMREHDLAPEDA